MKNKDLIKLIPNKVRVTSKVAFEVVWVDGFPNDEKQMGETRHSESLKQIVISNTQPQNEVFKTFLHESIHALDLVDEIGLTESQVCKLENGLFRMLKLNKVLEKLVKME